LEQARVLLEIRFGFVLDQGIATEKAYFVKNETLTDPATSKPDPFQALKFGKAIEEYAEMDLLTKITFAFEHGGFWMWPILAIQLVSISIVLERSYALFFKRKKSEIAFAESLEDSIRRGEIDSTTSKAQAAVALHPLARAVIAGSAVAKNFGGREEIQGKMDEVLIAENSLLDLRVAFLAMLGNVATLTGLLGTITGMIRSFAAVAYANPAEKAALLASGISEAMNCTAYGLITAIPALVMYAVLQNRANHLAEDLNQAALKIFNLLSFSYDPVALRASNATHLAHGKDGSTQHTANA
jgi:biopolymer transport protein ExbB